jgi:hypothetical protein
MPAILPPSSTPGPFVPLDTPQQLTAGNDAKQESGSALVWLSSKWPNLAGATLAFTVGHNTSNIFSNLPLTWTGTVPASPASPTTIHLDVPASSTLALPQGEYDYLLTATLAGGDRVTLATAKLTVLALPGSNPLFTPAV